jgi:hypothetical protein
MLYVVKLPPAGAHPEPRLAWQLLRGKGWKRTSPPCPLRSGHSSCTNTVHGRATVFLSVVSPVANALRTKGVLRMPQGPGMVRNLRHQFDAQAWELLQQRIADPSFMSEELRQKILATSRYELLNRLELHLPTY